MMIEFKNIDESKLSNIAKKLASLLFKGSIVLLYGDLGSGKTTFTRYLVEGLEGDAYQVTSPTFTIVNEYDALLRVYHIDLFRLGEEEVDEFPLEEYFEAEGVCVVEWPEKMENYRPNEFFKVELEFVDEVRRNVEIEAVGKRYEETLKRGEFFAEI
jgi:tRNA threonylcarbamoyladenosine biosynthesis protein TsaE